MDSSGMVFCACTLRPVPACRVRWLGDAGWWPLCGLAGALLWVGTCAAAEIKIETGDRKAGTGDTVSYALYLPSPSAAEATVLRPAVILLHGFARHYRYHARNAAHLAEHGFVVLTPNLVSLMAGRSAQERNAQIAADHIAWLTERGETPGDSLYHRIDPSRIGLAGHSAGGAVAFEAAVAAQPSRYRAAAVCLLDGVPWEATIQAAAALQPVPLCSLRSEPSAWNARAQVLRLLKAIPFPVDDVRIVGASHVDPENPTDVMADWFAGGVHPKCQELYQRLMLQFFEEALGNSSPSSASGRYLQSIQDLQKEGLIAVAGQQAEPQEVAAPPTPGPR